MKVEIDKKAVLEEMDGGAFGGASSGGAMAGGGVAIPSYGGKAPTVKEKYPKANLAGTK